MNVQKEDGYLFIVRKKTRIPLKTRLAKVDWRYLLFFSILFHMLPMRETLRVDLRGRTRVSCLVEGIICCVLEKENRLLPTVDSYMNSRKCCIMHF